MTAWTARIGAAVLAASVVLAGATVEAKAPEAIAPSGVQRVFVAPIAVEGELGKPVQRELAARLAEGLAQPGVELVTDEGAATHVVRTVVKAV